MLLRVLCYRQGTTLADLPDKALAGGTSGIIKIAPTPSQDPLLVTRRRGCDDPES